MHRVPFESVQHEHLPPALTDLSARDEDLEAHSQRHHSATLLRGLRRRSTVQSLADIPAAQPTFVDNPVVEIKRLADDDGVVDSTPAGRGGYMTAESPPTAGGDLEHPQEPAVSDGTLPAPPAAPATSTRTPGSASAPATGADGPVVAPDNEQDGTEAVQGTSLASGTNASLNVELMGCTDL